MELYMKNCGIFYYLLYLPGLFLEWEMFETNIVENNQNLHFMFNIYFFVENHVFYEIILEMCCRDGHATD